MDHFIPHVTVRRRWWSYCEPRAAPAGPGARRHHQITVVSQLGMPAVAASRAAWTVAPEVVEQRIRTGVLPHDDHQTSRMEIQQSMGQGSFLYMLVAIFSAYESQ